MPGIVGLLTAAPRVQAERELGVMVDALRHESFHETGVWIDESLGVYVGWCARRNSFAATMPLRNERGDIVLVFSGEDFSDPGTARRLKQRGHAFNDESCEYIVHLSEEDATFPAALNGRFHGLLVDRVRRSATLFNDRYGLHRIYYHQARDAFYFAAEAKAILAVRPELASIDHRGLGELVSCGCVLENRTLFDEIHVLPGGAKWILRDGAAEVKGAYFQSREWEEQPPLDQQTYGAEMRATFSRNLSRYFAGREPIGLSLTGGLDTRMIMATRKPAAGSLRCYTFAGMYRDCQDVVVARRVAQACSQLHEIIRVGEEFLARFPAYAERSVYLTDGCVDVSRAPDLYVNEIARHIAPIRMTGNYGSEVLRLVRSFKPAVLASGPFSADFLFCVQQAEETHAAILCRHPLSSIVFQQLPWYHYGLLALEESQLSVRSPYLDNDLVRTAFRAPQSASTNEQIYLRVTDEAAPALRRIRTDRGLGGQGLSGLLSRVFREFEFKAEYAYDYGMPQWAARADRLLSPLHPERFFLGRHKFTHFRLWYRDVLSSYVREVLLDPSTLSRPYVARKGVEAVVHDHLAGRRNYTVEIHKLLTIELIHRLFAPGSSS